MCLTAMVAAGTNLKAQQVTIPLMSGWTWISYPSTDTVDFATALGSFTPAVGDVIESQYGMAEYIDGAWYGDVQQFYPGYGYLYYSTRTMPVFLTFNAQQPSPQVLVTTSEPMDITATSAGVGSTVTIGEGNHIFARGVCWGTEPNPDIDGSHTSDETVAGSQSVTLTELTPSTIYYVRAYVVTDYGLAYGDEQSFTTLDGGGSSGGHDYVDLGLPSGTLWATCNVGADTPEGYGDYFAWGETQTKSVYYWNTYQYCNSVYYTLTKYCYDANYGYNGFTDNLTVLQSIDDAATANWGSGWRMPTKEEWLELFWNTTKTWTTRNGVNGELFTATNGNSIFLPAAGYRGQSSIGDVGSYGVYWSSVLGSDYPYNAWRVGFLQPGGWNAGGDTRYFGHSVRAVYVAPQK